MPALTLARELVRAEPAARVLLLGAQRGIEARVLPGQGIPFRLLPMHPLYRSRVWRNGRILATAPAVVLGLRSVFRDLDPDLVVGTGGYASGPALAWALLTGRRTALQEQNAEPGLVTRLLSGRVDQLHLGSPAARTRLRPGAGTRVFTFGNPVAPPAGDAGGGDFVWPPGPLLGVVGGSQGARGLNERLLADLEAGVTWPRDYSLVWITGMAAHRAIAERVSRLPWSERIHVVPFIPGLGGQIHRFALVVSRSGAMFLAELAAAGVPAILVPFPGAAARHQSANAGVLAASGAAEVMEEAGWSMGELWNAACRILADPERRTRMAAAMRAVGRPEAAACIAAELLRLARQAREGGADDR